MFDFILYHLVFTCNVIHFCVCLFQVTTAVYLYQFDQFLRPFSQFEGYKFFFCCEIQKVFCLRHGRKFKAALQKWKLGSAAKNEHKTRWEEDYELIENEGLFEEYLEMSE